MNKDEAAIVSAYTGFLIGDFSDMHAYIEKVLGRSVYTHEMAGKDFEEEIKAKTKNDFVQLSENITED